MNRAGAFIAGCAGTALSAEEIAFFRDADPLGFILFARNIDTPDQIRALTAQLRDCVGRDAMILIDQEGGRVQRLRPPHWRKWIPALDQVAKAGDRATDVMRLRYRLIAAELRDLGIDVNCVPCADVVRSNTHSVLHNRCYANTADQVVPIARAVTEGCLKGGVLPVLKHIPGHGAATADSHLELPRVDLPGDVLLRQDFAAFRDLSDLPLGMTAHVVFDAFDSDHCATNSPILHKIMREDLGFEGLLMSDDISMQALSGDMGARCDTALQAGCDIVLHCNGDLAEMQAVAAASGRLNDNAATRADAALAMRGDCEDPAQITELWNDMMGPDA